MAGVKTLNISLGGAFRSYPPADHSPVVYDFFNTISILDGGIFEFHGTAADGDRIKIDMEGDLVIRGGGEMIVNNLELSGEYLWQVANRHTCQLSSKNWESPDFQTLSRYPDRI